MSHSYKSSDKVWVYTANRKLTEEDQFNIKNAAMQFLNSWESHGSTVIGDVKVVKDHFVVVVADDCNGDMCGRAQDAQVRFMKELEGALELSLLNRMLLAYRTDSEISTAKMPEFSEKIKSGEINENTIVYNNTITSYGEFTNSWEVPLKDSWHKQLLA